MCSLDSGLNRLNLPPKGMKTDTKNAATERTRPLHVDGGRPVLAGLAGTGDSSTATANQGDRRLVRQMNRQRFACRETDHDNFMIQRPIVHCPISQRGFFTCAQPYKTHMNKTRILELLSQGQIFRHGVTSFARTFPGFAHYSVRLQD